MILEREPVRQKTAWNAKACFFQAYKQKIEAFFAGLREAPSSFHEPPIREVAFQGHRLQIQSFGGSSNWGGDDGPNSMALFYWGAVIIIGQIMGDYGYPMVQKN